jgi:hypothetical protein
MTAETDVQKTDRSTWGAGPWDGEPDRVDFHAAGYACLLHRAGRLGHWCGYVAVPPGHPLHGVGYDAAEARADLRVHGGLTYADKCQGTICHVPVPGESDDVWWLGFDCAHAGDHVPNRPPFDGDVYRDVAYVRRETEMLALQIAAYTRELGHPEASTAAG